MGLWRKIMVSLLLCMVWCWLCYYVCMSSPMYGIAGSDISQSTIEVWLSEEASIARDAPSRGCDSWFFYDNVVISVYQFPQWQCLIGRASISSCFSHTTTYSMFVANNQNIMNQFIIIVTGRHSVKVTNCCRRSLLSAAKCQGQIDVLMMACKQAQHSIAPVLLPICTSRMFNVFLMYIG